MVYADKATGGAGYLRIDFDGTTVRFYVYGGYSSTNHYDPMDWSGTVNGVGVGGSGGVGGTGPAWGYGSKAAPGLLFGAWTANYGSQTVSFTMGATGTSGLGGPTTLDYAIYRAYPATAPPAPTSVGLDQITPTSMRYRFSGNGDGGSGITAWQYEYSTSSNFSSGNSGAINGSGTENVTGLANHTTYYFRSRGVNAVGTGGWSTPTISAATTGHPTVPLSLAATPSASATGRIALTWSQPTTTGAGGITGYNIFRNGTQIATTTGTLTGYTATGLTPYTSYTFTVAARNAYSDSVAGTSPLTSGVAATAPGPPGAPTNLAGVSDGAQAGKVNLSWTAPTNTGAGGITGYRVRLADGTLIVNQAGTATTYSATGLTPGVAYTFKVSARNALSDAEGSEGAFSSQVVVTPIGEPGAPTNVSVAQSTTTSNRLVLSWSAPAGTLSGYSIFRQIDSSGPFILVRQIGSAHTSYSFDDMPLGVPQTFHVRARTVYTDTLASGYPGNWGGPASANVVGTATINNSQTLLTSATVADQTNAVFNGSYVINQVTSTTVRYAKTAANVASAASGGSISNTTNAIFNGSYTISTPTSTTISYAKTNANIAILGTTGGTVTDTTNQSFNGTVTVTAVNAGANTVSYNSPGADLAPTTVPVNASPGQSGTVTNLSNAIFNGVGKTITAITEFTIKYGQTSANVTESNAAGTVINTTNRDTFNGSYVVSSIPANNIVQYARTASNILTRTWLGPNGVVSRASSPALLDVQFRSGWSG